VAQAVRACMCEIEALNLPHLSWVIENYHSLNTATAALLHSLYRIACK